MVPTRPVAVWRSITTVPGALSVTTTGTYVMQRWSVDSWDLPVLTAQSHSHTLEVELVIELPSYGE